MSRRESVKREQISTKIKKELLTNLRKYSEESGINMNRIVEKALEEWLSKREGDK